jgi:NIPSNAP
MELMATEASCAVVELRQYTLHPGQRDALMSLFEREFVDPLEAACMTVMGQFLDLDRPDRFVWMRGFPDMYRRAQGLAAFYSGPVWHAHREAANATMIDSNNVLLLRPAREGAGISLAERQRVLRGRASRARIVATINALARPANLLRITEFETAIAPALEQAGARILGHYVTETSANTFPRLPVREGEHVFVWFSWFTDDDAYAHFLARLQASPSWHEKSAAWNRGLIAAPEVLRLAPTVRSLINE